MEVRIGVNHSPRVVELEVDDSIDRDALRDHVDSILAEGLGVLWLTDRKGREVGVPAGSIAYVEIGSPAEGRSIGFSA